MLEMNVVPEKAVEKNTSDMYFIATMLLLLGLGLVTLFTCSASYANRIFDDSFYFIKRQLISCFIGFIVLFILSYIDMQFVRKMLPLIVIGTFFLCLLTYLPGIGVERNGARRWIRLPLLSNFQPSELVKIAIVLYLANLFDKKYEIINDVKKTIIPAVSGIMLFVFVIFLQDDFSTAFFILLVSVSMFFLAGLSLYWFISLFLVSIPVLVLFIFTESYRVNRIIAFLNPLQDLHGINYQINASIKAISNGGFWGEGFGIGLQKSSAIPEVQADFIFAGWVEGMGLFGVLLYLLLLGFFSWRIYLIAFRSEDRFSSYVAFGLGTSLVLQSLLNIAVVVGAVPATGIPLPFFSSGGSSLLISLAMCGLIINISKNNKKEAKYE
jgi:cell division protein FtsW